ncbi:hypothetical protein [Clostridium intestinale]|uniref:hypothetical protein n=1 Tax=Clostridium intestinale TaxID=36845 RepID=UPI0028E8A70A|nr:hypothetical protein [Clostridium intestinale]
MQSIELMTSIIKDWCRSHKGLVSCIDPKALAVDIKADLIDCMDALVKIVADGYGTKYIKIECPGECEYVNLIDADMLEEKIECISCGQAFTPKNYIKSDKLMGFQFFIEDEYFHESGLNPLKYINSDNVIELSDRKDEKERGKKSLNKPKKIFISHSSCNSEIAGKVVDLLETIGVKTTNIYYSSFEDTGAKLLSDCLDSIAKEFNENELLVIFIISKEFYKSNVCLAETGATWISTKSNYIPIILPPYNYGHLDGVIKGTQNSISLGDESLSSKIEKLKSTVIDFLNIENNMSAEEWDRKKNKFIKEAKEYEKSIIDVEANLKEVKIKNNKILFKMLIKNNTRDRIRIDDMGIDLRIREGGNLRIDISKDTLEAIAIKAFEDIEIYLFEYIKEEIKTSKIDVRNSKILINKYVEE